MYNEKFIKFLHNFNMDDSLLEVILSGYKTVFFEGVNGSVARSTPGNTPFNDTSPFVNPIRPMGEPVFDKFVTGVPSGLGGSGDNNGSTSTDQTYKYSAALPGSTRDIGEETIEDSDDWSKSLPKLPAVKTRSSKYVKNLIKNAHENIPKVSPDNSKTGISYNSNYAHGYLGISSENNTPPFQA
jgi:hypothetical protein